MKRNPTVIAIILLSFTALALGQPANPADLDEDGLADALEAQLIQRHRPVLHYNSDESHWPSTVTWFVQRSNLHYCNQNNVIFSRLELTNDPLLVLQGRVRPLPLDGCFLASDVWSSVVKMPGETSFALDLLDADRGGMGPMPVGMYAHVVEVAGAIDRSCGRVINAGERAILVQYFQFFPMNETPFCLDHEGDWLRLDVYVESNPPYSLRAIVYDPHGSSAADRCRWGSNLPADGIPDCYLESGSHEWWPCPTCPGTGEYCNFAWGDGVTYRAANILNLGERWAPLCSWDEEPDVERSLALFFNGGWGQEGENPSGPANRSEEVLPTPRAFVVRYVDASVNNSLLHSSTFIAENFLRGSRYYPSDTFAGVLGDHASGGVSDGGTVVFLGGTYPENLTITKPMLLTTVRGPALIGE
ncbi:MAG: hypothetical protein IT438_04035 [Phycisphaerales bacterium]|nr:hypothetical protein [Phycisphaerales bacterium]